MLLCAVGMIVEEKRQEVGSGSIILKGLSFEKVIKVHWIPPVLLHVEGSCITVLPVDVFSHSSSTSQGHLRFVKLERARKHQRYDTSSHLPSELRRSFDSAFQRKVIRNTVSKLPYPTSPTVLQLPFFERASNVAQISRFVFVTFVFQGVHPSLDRIALYSSLLLTSQHQQSC